MVLDRDFEQVSFSKLTQEVGACLRCVLSLCTIAPLRLLCLTLSHRAPPSSQNTQLCFPLLAQERELFNEESEEEDLVFAAPP